MKRHVSRILPTALAAVLVLGACGSADDDASPDPPAETPGTAADGDLRAPSPIEVVSGGGGDTGERATASAEGSMAADDMMIAPYYDIEYVLTEGLTAPTDDTGYVYDAAAEVTAEQVAALAAALGVAGEPQRIDDGYTVSWRVGPDDGSAPSLWVSDDAQQYWNYSSAWAEQDSMAREACAVAVDSAGNEAVEECEEPEPPAGVPTAEEAEQRTHDLLSTIGVDPATVTFETYADEWFASVTANATLDARTALTSWNFGFGAEGMLQYASGSLATPAPVGPYPLIDIDAAFARLQDQAWAGFMARGGLDTAAIATDTAVAAPEPAPDMPESGEPSVEPLPADDVLVDPPVDGSIPEPETITVTLVDVQADLWWAWDVDGTVWLLPAYRFIGDDGGWYTVPAVTDEYLIQVDPPVVEEPIPVEPGDGTGSTEPGDPGDAVGPAVPAEDLAGLVGSPLADFTAKAESGGWTVRVVEIDGESLAVTDDFRTDRINVAVVSVDGVEQVVRATLDDGTLIAEATIEPAEPAPATTEPGTAPTESVPPVEPTAVTLAGIYDGISFYPACGNETLEHEGVTWYQVNERDFPEQYGAAVAVEREQPLDEGGVRGFARVVAPGPGDDVGTLLVWADGVARFTSDSGDLTAWLIDDELTYNWVC
jgi:hypothetical protein